MKGMEGLAVREPQEKVKDNQKQGLDQKIIAETYFNEFREKPVNSNNKFLYYAFTTALMQDSACSTKFGVKSEIPLKARIAKRDNLANTTDGDKTVATAQASLMIAGYDLGKAGIDGIQGKQTTQALKEFQKAAGFKPTGLLNSETRYALTIVTAGGLDKAKIEQFNKSPNNFDVNLNKDKTKQPNRFEPNMKNLMKINDEWLRRYILRIVDWKQWKENNKETSKLKENQNANTDDKAPWNAVIPKFEYISGKRDPKSYNKLIDQFHVNDNKRYEPRNGNTYCNIFAWDVSIAMGVELPRFVKVKLGHPEDPTGEALGRTSKGNKVDPPMEATATELDANKLAIWLKSQGKNCGWEKLKTPEQAQKYANQGYMTLGIIDESPKIGHVIIVRPMPEGMKYDSGKGIYFAQAGKTNLKGAFFKEHFSKEYVEKEYNNYAFFYHR
jgi:peptidoglycan hydrolase-like protein with peptidoglycan-binding domain